MNSIEKKRKSIINIFLFLFDTAVFFSCFKIPYYNYTTSDYAKTILLIRFCFFIVFVVYVILKNSSKSQISISKKSPTIIYSSILTVWIMISTIINGNTFKYAFTEMLPFIFLPAYFFIFLDNKERRYNVINYWRWLLLALVIIDICCFYIYPNGMYDSGVYTNNWFLGYKTQRMVFAFPLIVLWGLYQIKNYSSIGKSTFLVCFIAFYDAYITDGSGGMAAILFTFVFYIVIENVDKIKLFKRMTFINDIVTMMIIYSIITVIVIGAQYSGLIAVITQAFGRDASFTGRDHIWKMCLEQIASSPIIGKGVLQGNDYSLITGFHGGTNAHNLVITILMDGGIIGLLIYCTLIIKSFRFNNGRAAHYLRASMYAFFILGITSSILVFSEIGLLIFILINYEENDYIICKESIE